MNTIDTRYEVSDSVCGSVSHHQVFWAALVAARKHQRGHAEDTVVVSDRMARPGNTCLWDASCKPIRTQKPS